MACSSKSAFFRASDYWAAKKNHHRGVSFIVIEDVFNLVDSHICWCDQPIREITLISIKKVSDLAFFYDELFLLSCWLAAAIHCFVVCLVKSRLLGCLWQTTIKSGALSAVRVYIVHSCVIVAKTGFYSYIMTFFDYFWPQERLIVLLLSDSFFHEKSCTFIISRYYLKAEVLVVCGKWRSDCRPTPRSLMCFSVWEPTQQVSEVPTNGMYVHFSVDYWCPLFLQQTCCTDQVMK